MPIEYTGSVETPSEPTGERSLIQQPKRGTNQTVLIGGLAIIAVIGFSALVFMINTDPPAPSKQEMPVSITKSVPTFEVPPPKEKPKPKPVIVEVEKPVTVPVNLTRTIIRDPAPMRQAVPIANADEARKLSPSIGRPDAQPAPTSGPNVAPFPPGVPNIDLTVTKTPIMAASVLPDQSLLIVKGTPMPCVMQTAIQSDQPGLLTCSLTQDVWSRDASTLLLPKGSHVTGEYRSSSLRPGMNRIFAIWDRIATPDGVVIDIDSPATGSLGRAGIGGTIDRHWDEKFTAAILISIVDDALGSAHGRTENTETALNDAAENILEDNLNIPDTLHKAQGGLINIMVARDLDFSSVFEHGFADAR